MKKKEFEVYLQELEEIDNVREVFFGIFSATTHINTESYDEFTLEQLTDSLAVLYMKYGEMKYLTEDEIRDLPTRTWGETEEEKQWLEELFNEIVSLVQEEKYGPCIEL